MRKCLAWRLIFLPNYRLVKNFLNETTVYIIKFDTFAQSLSFNYNGEKSYKGTVLAEKNLQNKWLAEKLGKDEATVSKWCINNIQPNFETIIRISEILGIEFQKLIRVPNVNRYFQ